MKKKRLVGIIVILILCIVSTGIFCYIKLSKRTDNSPIKNNILTEKALATREKRLQKAHGEEWKIHSEIHIKETDNFVFSAAYSPEWIGIKIFPRKNKFTKEKLTEPFFSTEADHISQDFRFDGTYYKLFWINRPDVDYAEITYTVDGKELEPIQYDAKKIFYSKTPTGDYSYKLVYYDVNGNAYPDIPNSELKSLNLRVMIDGKIYCSTGKISIKKHEGKPDGKITSAVSKNQIPTKNNQSNFGFVGMYGNDHNYYRIYDNTVDIFMDENWITFKTPWNIELSAKNITPEGADLIFTHSGQKKGDDFNFHTKGNYWIEQKTETGWTKLPLSAETIWNDEEVYFIFENDSITIPVDWEYLYGKLSPGKYRIGKEIIWKEYNAFEDVEYLMRTYYAEFEIQE